MYVKPFSAEVTTGKADIISRKIAVKVLKNLPANSTHTQQTPLNTKDQRKKLDF
jgi:hypothetical protein